MELFIDTFKNNKYENTRIKFGEYKMMCGEYTDLSCISESDVTILRNGRASSVPPTEVVFPLSEDVIELVESKIAMEISIKGLMMLSTCLIISGFF